MENEEYHGPCPIPECECEDALQMWVPIVGAVLICECGVYHISKVGIKRGEPVIEMLD